MKTNLEMIKKGYVSDYSIYDVFDLSDRAKVYRELKYDPSLSEILDQAVIVGNTLQDAFYIAIKHVKQYREKYAERLLKAELINIDAGMDMHQGGE